LCQLSGNAFHRFQNLKIPKIALAAIQIANLLAQNKTQQIPAALETLQQSLAAQPDTFTVGWSFAGTKHFISIEPNPDGRGLARYRAWLLQFFAAIEGENRAAILAGLQAARAGFQTVGKKE
jgi:hypothetical protein